MQIGERNERGHLGIASSTIPAEYLLPPLLAKFRAQHPLAVLGLPLF